MCSIYVIHKAKFIIMSQMIPKKVHYVDHRDHFAFSTLFLVENLILVWKTVLKMKIFLIYIILDS